MPTSLLGLLLFVGLLAPGYVAYLQRQDAEPRRRDSPLLEAMSLVSVSLITNGAVLGLFAALRFVSRSHTPDLQRLLVEGVAYAAPRAGYLTVWSLAGFATSCLLALGLERFRPLRGLRARFAPIFVDASSWGYVFEAAPTPTSAAYVECELDDGSYVAGELDWYSTDAEGARERELVLARSIHRPVDGSDVERREARLVVASRSIVRLWVTWIERDSGRSPVAVDQS